MKNYVIFGTGAGASKVFSFWKSRNYDIVAFVDNNKSKQGTLIFGVPIITPEELEEIDVYKIAIGSQYSTEIEKQLLDLGITKDKIWYPEWLVKGRIFPYSTKSHPFPFIAKPTFEPETTCRQDVFKMLWLSVEQVYYSATDGDVAEFGCGNGQSSYILAEAIKACNRYYQESLRKHGLIEKNLHLFDSFEKGQSGELGADKEYQQQIALFESIENGTTAHQLADTFNYWLDFVQFYIYAGWFNETTNQIPQASNFSLIHFGNDLWESCYNVLDYLFSNKQIEEGCIILFDDWSRNRASNLCGQRRVWKEMTDKYHIDWTTLGFYGLGCHRITIHGYNSK